VHTYTNLTVPIPTTSAVIHMSPSKPQVCWSIWTHPSPRSPHGPIASPASSAATCVGSDSFYSCASRSASSAKSCLAISVTYLMREAIRGH
jgi:hypothetical protein